MKKKLGIILLALIIYILSAGVSYTFFTKSGVSQGSNLSDVTAPKQTNNYDALVFDAKAPKTEACPLNGVLYSKQQETWWQGHRPLGVMIENEIDARPQSGISFADVTYEAVAEGGITRTLNVYYCQDAGIIGPVRSARTYFLDYISEYGDYPLYAHVGGANTPGLADALGQIDTYGWTGYNDLNQFSVGFPTYWRDEGRAGHPVATEHTMYSETTKLWKVGETRDLTNVDKNGKSWDTNFVPYKFKDDAAVSDRGSINSIDIPFWGYDDYVVDWNYDNASNLYLRTNGGKPHIDRNTGKQLSAKDVVILFETENHANDGYTDNEHLLYGTTGSGRALIFMNGTEIKGTWSKDSRTSRTILTDSNGNEVTFTRGKLWFEIVAADAQITVK